MRKSKILKCISYCLIPFLVLIILVSLLYESAKEDIIQNNEEETVNFFETDSFLSRYMSKLSSNARKLIYDNDDYHSIENGDMKICYSDTYNLAENSYYNIKDYYYLIIYKNIALTNVELTTQTNTIDGIKDFIFSQEGKKSNIINGEIEAESEVIKNKSIQYFDNFNFNYYTVEYSEVEEEYRTDEEVDNITYKYATSPIVQTSDENSSNINYYNTTISDFQIFTSYKEELIDNNRDVFFENLIKSLSFYETQMLYAVPIATILLLIILIYLLISIGYTKNKEGIDLNDLDKIPIEIIIGITVLVISLIICAASESLYYVTNDYYDFALNLVITGYFVSYIVCAITGVTLIKRIKAKTLIKDSITGRFCLWCIKIINKIFSKIKYVYKQITSSMDVTVKLVFGILIYAIGTIFLIAAFNVLGVIISLVIFGYFLYKTIVKINCYKKIEEHLKHMYEGEHSIKLNSSDFTNEFKDIVKYINDISSGFENAIEEGIKSERLKTELITNVSHDIKTPLTSIINYVDLLKKEEIDNEKVKEYMDILDNKSQRLKKLTEDLVEASKASSGNVKLNIEKINIGELIKQTTGEFEDRFSDKKLEVVSQIPEEDLYINADNRYMYRIIENLFSNISKYALEGSRVYIDIKRVGNKVKIYIKNISRERLNISADELMQRFVRGDKSRTTEGSGLGISISKSLTEIQKGSFDLQVDGDLFKVTLEFEII